MFKVNLYGYTSNPSILILYNPIIGLIERMLIVSAKYGVKPENVEIEFSREYIKALLDEYSKLGILSPKDQYYYSNIPIIEEEEYYTIVSSLKEVSDRIVEYVKRHSVDLHRGVKRAELEARGYTWDDIREIIILGLLMDKYFYRVLHETGILPPPPKRPDGGFWYMWITIIRKPLKYEYSVYEYNSIIGGSATLKFEHLTPTRYLILQDYALLMAALISIGYKSLDQLSYILRVDRDQILKVIGEWRRLGLLELEEDRVMKLNFLALTPKDIDTLVRCVYRLASEIVNSIIVKYRSSILKLKYDLKIPGEEGSFLALAFHTVKCIVTEELCREGIVRIPEKPPVSWGLWCWVTTMPPLIA